MKWSGWRALIVASVVVLLAALGGVWWGRHGHPSGSTGPAPLTVPATTTPPTSTTNPLDPVPLGTAGPHTPSPSRPARVLIIGDSEASGLAPFLRRVLQPSGAIEITEVVKVSSGLSRPDFYDWPRQLGSTMITLEPDVVVVMMGGNDAQPLRDSNGGLVAIMDLNDPATWQAEYRLRIEEILDLASIGDAGVVWVGIPNARSKSFNARLTVLDASVRSALDRRPEVQFVDSWTLFSNRKGGWAKAVHDPFDGRRKNVRQSDGFHLNADGTRMLARDVGAAVINELRRRGTDVTLDRATGVATAVAVPDTTTTSTTATTPTSTTPLSTTSTAPTVATAAAPAAGSAATAGS